MRAAALALALLAVPAAAHDGVNHASKAKARAHLGADDAPVTPFPVALGGPFALTDQHGAARTEADPDGRLQLLFFGYATCQAICTVALPRMAEIAEIAAEAGLAVRPVLVTVDPARDTPEAMGAALAELHPDFVGLTGPEAALAAARAAFRVESKVVFEDPELGPVFAHGSFIYLLDGAGRLLTLIAPIADPESGAAIVAKYAGAGL